MTLSPTSSRFSQSAADALYLQKSLADAKGDIIAATAADVFARLPVGADGEVLTAASGEATGLDWAAVASAFAWADWTPVLTGSVSNPSGLQTIDGRQITSGKLVIAQARLLYGAAPTVGSGDFRMSLPTTPAGSSWASAFLNAGMFYDSSTTTAIAMYPRLDAANTRVTFFSELDGTTLQCTSMAANDQIYVTMVYEAA